MSVITLREHIYLLAKLWKLQENTIHWALLGHVGRTYSNPILNLV